MVVGLVLQLMMGYHEGESPQSRSIVWGSARIWIASTVLFFQKPRAVPWTRAPSQSMLWLVVWACTAIPFCLSPFFTACLCPLILVFNVLLVSPMYTLLTAVLARNLVHHFLLLFFRHLLLHFHQ